MCVIKSGGRGICGVRENMDGTLYTLVYDKIIATHVDPIEKKPLFHFLPGSSSYSIATVGCNFRCLFCQNADISQMPSDHKSILGEAIEPHTIVDSAWRSRSVTISYTYTEPTIYFELALDTSRLAIKRGIRNIFVTNGYMTETALREIHPDLHGANVDLKSFSNEFYKKQCGSKLEPVLNSIKLMKKMGVWVEVTTLLIPGLNDSPDELKAIAEFIVDVDPDIPWHISRFHPTYRLTDRPPTPPESIRRAREIGYGQGLRFVYSGNLPGDEGENTYCPECSTILVERFGFYVKNNRIRQGRCPECGYDVPGVWE
jgi:pyruvate formate lyase activating enzyme